jgi:nicotinate-nucleotide--dimethylbenzimidazole phosphoribosyltransferase
LPRGARLEFAEWTKRAVAVRDARRALVGAADDPDALLAAACRLAADHAEVAEVAGGEACRLALACGLLLHATSRRTPVVLDGVGAAAAAALCARVVPEAPLWWRAAERGDDPAFDAAVGHIGAEPVAPVAAGGVGGVAGAMAVLTLRMAVRAVAS